MFNWNEIQYEMEMRPRERLAWAEKERLIRELSKHNALPTKAYQRWLVRLGGWLVAWGHRLQARYGQSLAGPSALQQEC